MSGEPGEGSLVPSSLKRVTGLRKGTEWSERRVGVEGGQALLFTCLVFWKIILSNMSSSQT